MLRRVEVEVVPLVCTARGLLEHGAHKLLVGERGRARRAERLLRVRRLDARRALRQLGRDDLVRRRVRAAEHAQVDHLTRLRVAHLRVRLEVVDAHVHVRRDELERHHAVPHHDLEVARVLDHVEGEVVPHAVGRHGVAVVHPLARAHLAVELLVELEELLDLVDHQPEAPRRAVAALAVHRRVRRALVEVVPVDRDRVHAVDRALRLVVRLAVLRDLVVEQVQRERGGRRVALERRHVLHLDQEVVVVVRRRQLELEVDPLRARARAVHKVVRRDARRAHVPGRVRRAVPHPRALGVGLLLRHDLVRHAVLAADEHHVHVVVRVQRVGRVAVLDEGVLVARPHVQVRRRELERRLVDRRAVPHHHRAVAAVLGDAEAHRALLAHVLVLPVVVDEVARAQLAVHRDAVDQVRLDLGGEQLEARGAPRRALHRHVVRQVGRGGVGRREGRGGREPPVAAAAVRHACRVRHVRRVGGATRPLSARGAGVVDRLAQLVLEVGHRDRHRVDAVHRVRGEDLGVPVGRQLAPVVQEQRDGAWARAAVEQLHLEAQVVVRVRRVRERQEVVDVLARRARRVRGTLLDQLADPRLLRLVGHERVLARRAARVVRRQLVHVQVVRRAVAAAEQRDPVAVARLQVAEDAEVDDLPLVQRARRRLLARRRVVAHERHEREVTHVLRERELHVVTRRARLRRRQAGETPSPVNTAAAAAALAAVGDVDLEGGLKRVVDVLLRADLAVHRVAAALEPPADLEGHHAELLRAGAALDRQVVRAHLQLDRRDGDREQPVVRDTRDELGLSVERDGTLEEVKREAARRRLVLVSEQLDLEDDVVLDLDHVLRRVEVKVVPLVCTARGALEMLHLFSRNQVSC